jgi:hypothetical protein
VSRGLQKAYHDHAREAGILHERLNTMNTEKRALADQVCVIVMPFCRYHCQLNVSTFSLPSSLPPSLPPLPPLSLSFPPSLPPLSIYTWQLVKTQSRVEQLEHELKRAEVTHAMCARTQDTRTTIHSLTCEVACAL